MKNSDNDLVVFRDEGGPKKTRTKEKPWRILIVDDKEEVHNATKYAFKLYEYRGRNTTFSSAYDSVEARTILKKHPDICCIFLDVVMETESAGLDLVKYIREELGNDKIRIILHTGHPGCAPEVSVMQDYDINDYREKSSSTRIQLFTALTAALRSYQQISDIEKNRAGLELVINASTSLLSMQKLDEFASTCIAKLCDLLSAPAEGMVCISSREHMRNGIVVAAIGGFKKLERCRINDFDDFELRRNIALTSEKKRSRFCGNRCYLYIPVKSMHGVVVVINTTSEVNENDGILLDLFCINLSIGFDNVSMYQEVEALAYRDQLTGLPNRVMFFKLIDKVRKKNKENFLLAVIDINHFEIINDGLGIDVGDKVIQHVARKLDATPGSVATARIAGDVFGVLVEQGKPEFAEDTMARISNMIKGSVEVEGNNIQLALTIGGACFSGGKYDAKILLSNASIALNHAKNKRKINYCLFSQSMDNALKNRLRMAEQLQQALNNDEFFLLYQPQIDLKTGMIIGVEALVRWRREGKVVPPIQFIPVAENSGLIVPLGSWILEKAIQQQVAWREMGHELRMSVNVSPRELTEEKYIEQVESLMSQYDIAENQLELEITETMIMSDTDVIIEKLLSLKKLGITIAIDDFGTGYSSLGQLQKLPVDRLKIDQFFIKEVDKNPENAHIAAMIIKMGHELEIAVIAEGVEEASHKKILEELNCDEAQGYHFAKPLLPEDIIDFTRIHWQPESSESLQPRM